MMICPAPAQHASGSRPNTLRITPALSAIAAVMNGLDPEPADVAALADTTISVQTLHLGAAAALRQVMRPLLLARSSAGGGRKALTPADSALFDAYYLAVELANRGDQPTRIDPSRVESALLVGAMQVRFLEAVCSQIEISITRPELSVAAKAPARSVLSRGGQLAPGVRLLPDHSSGGTADGTSWLHAQSTITVAGMVGTEVVDAGPDNASALWAARLAAPVTVTATGGLWPVTVVEDCLRISSRAVRRWVAAMPRELCGEDGRDIMLRSGPALRDFLVSPATATLTGDSGKTEVLPLRPALAVRPGKSPKGVLSAMRVGGVPGTELSPDLKLDGGIHVGEIRRDELAVLSAAAPTELPDAVEVTVNFAVPEWKNVGSLFEQVRETGALALTQGVLGWTERDVVAGQLHRVSLRARVRRGVVCHTHRGDAVLLPAGTTFTILGADAGRGHVTFYGLQCDPEMGAGTRRKDESAA